MKRTVICLILAVMLMSCLTACGRNGEIVSPSPTSDMLATEPPLTTAPVSESPMATTPAEESVSPAPAK